MIKEEKKLLRAKYTEIRALVADKEAKSEAMYDYLISSSFYECADTVLLYWSTSSEVITHKMINKALSDGKRLALPKCIDKNGNMLFYYIKSAEDLIDGMYGIKEPATDELADSFSDSDICIVPGLSFTEDGYRLGYGKGYYDRFLQNFPGTSIGLCYEDCLAQSLPIDQYDKKVNYIITDKTIYKIKEE